MQPSRGEQLTRSLVRVWTCPEQQGMGVFTRAGHVLTAAHCLPQQPDPEHHALLYDLGPEYRVRVPCRVFHAEPLHVLFQAISTDPCNDIAVLAHPDLFADPSWQPFASALSSPTLRLDPPLLGVPMNIHIFTHENIWL